MQRSQLLSILAAAPQEQLEASLERLMARGLVSASRARQVYEEAMARRRSWVVKT